MRSRKAPGLTNICVDHLKQWYAGAFPDRDNQDPDLECVEQWGTVRKIVQGCFRTGTAPLAFSLGTLVIIPKDDNGRSAE